MQLLSCSLSTVDDHHVVITINAFEFHTLLLGEVDKCKFIRRGCIVLLLLLIIDNRMAECKEQQSFV